MKYSFLKNNLLFIVGLLLFMTIFPTTSFAQETLYDAKQYFKHKEYAKAIPIFLKYAQQGDPEAQFLLGKSYYEHEGINRDYEKIMSWYEKAANKGVAEAQYELGELYVYPPSGYIAPPKMFYWLEKAGNQGYIEAIRRLIYWYYKDTTGFFKRNVQKCTYWAQIGADLGDSFCQGWLGSAYTTDKLGVNKDYKKAFFWSEKAAIQGDSASYNFVGAWL